MVWGKDRFKRSQPWYAQTIEVTPIRFLCTDPAQSKPGSASNGCFAQRLASCWLPGVRNPQEPPSTLLWGWLRRARVLSSISALPQPQQEVEYQVGPLTVVRLLSFRTNHPSNESTLSLFFRSLLPNFNLQVCAVSCCGQIRAHFCCRYTEVSTAQCFCKGSGSWHMQCVNVRLQSSLMLFGKRHCLSPCLLQTGRQLPAWPLQLSSLAGGHQARRG